MTGTKKCANFREKWASPPLNALLLDRRSILGIQSFAQLILEKARVTEDIHLTVKLLHDRSFDYSTPC